MPNYIAAEVRAYNIATHGAQLSAAIVDLRHSAKTPGASVDVAAVQSEITDLRAILADIESILNLTQAEAA